MTARWLLAVSMLAEGCTENQDELMALGAAEAAMQVGPCVRFVFFETRIDHGYRF